MKLIVCDFDNTLKIHTDSIDHKKLWRNASVYNFYNNYLKLQSAKSNGSMIVLATGRDFQNVKDALNNEGVDISLFDYICCTEGATIYHNTSELFDASYIADDAFEYLKTFNIDGVKMIISKCNEKANRIIYRTKAKHLHDYILSKLQSIEYIDICYDKTDIQILPKGVNKCKAITKILKVLNISSDSVYCFGDSLNDLYLFNKYTGYAMRWADKSLQKASYAIIDSVAEGLELLINQDSIISTNKMMFSFYDDEIAYANCLIKQYKNQYSTLLSTQKKTEDELDLIFDLDREKQNYNDYCSRIRDLIKEIVNQFVFFEGYDVNIVITGSFSRATAKTFSDIDISLFYENKFYPHVRKYEELFYYVLMEIFSLPRRSVHSVLITDSLQFDVEEKKENNAAYQNKMSIQLLYKSGKIYYEYIIDKENIAVITRIDRTTRDIASLKSYLKYLVSINIWKEWFVNFVLLKGNNEDWIILKDDIIEACIANKSEIANSLEQQRLFLKKHLVDNVIDTIDKYKYSYQMELLMFFYDVKSFREICKYQTHEFEAKVYEYLWLIRKIAKSFKRSGYIYSSHCKDQYIDDTDMCLSITRNSALELIDLIGEINGFINYSNEE